MISTQAPNATQPASGTSGPGMRPLGSTGLRVAPLVLGSNVFGWTIDERTSFGLLDAFVDAGFNAIDTADIYSVWAAGNRGGESEGILGRWLRARPGMRERVLVFTKVGGDFRDGRRGLSAAWIARAAEDSLARLQTDRIDLYQAHWPDPATAPGETLGAFANLMSAGKVRAIGCSNMHAAQVEASLKAARALGLPAYQTLQPEYNLCSRTGFEGGLRRLAVREGLGVLAHSGLARGFLTGKYRSRADLDKSPRGADLARFLGGRGQRILGALDQVADRLGARPGEVALAWLLTREGVTAPIASATSHEQLASLVRAARLELSGQDLRLLEQASGTPWDTLGLGGLRAWLAGTFRRLAFALGR